MSEIQPYKPWPEPGQYPESESKESKLASEATRLEAALRALEKAANAVVEWAAERWGGVEPIAIRELRAALASPTPSVGEESRECPGLASGGPGKCSREKPCFYCNPKFQARRP